MMDLAKAHVKAINAIANLNQFEAINITERDMGPLFWSWLGLSKTPLACPYLKKLEDVMATFRHFGPIQPPRHKAQLECDIRYRGSRERFWNWQTKNPNGY